MGEVDAVLVPIEPAVADVRFERQQPELTDELLAMLIGEYVPPIDGMTFTISAVDGKVYAAQTGSPAKEIKPYKLNDTMVGFTMERTRLDFMREKGSIPKMVLKAPGLTLEAIRQVNFLVILFFR